MCTRVRTRLQAFIAACLLFCTPSFATAGNTYEVGPGKAFSSIGAVPWSTLQAGDTVLIYYSPQPYREKILISGQGTADNWIRVLGVPGPGGELPIISGDGAVTSTNSKFHWQDPALIQLYGGIFIMFGDGAGNHALPASYIEIANLQIQDVGNAYSFTAENGATQQYDNFSACIYARSVRHLKLRNMIMTNCNLGFYDWTGGADTDNWWEALSKDITIQGSYFYGNGVPGGYLQHQVYTEADNVTIEFNRFGPMKSGALGSQIKDRSAGTVVRYNYIESTGGWMIDLVEPQEAFPAVGYKTSYKQTFVYGNVLWNHEGSQNMIHWNEDHQVGVGRASSADGRLFFYQNTLLVVSDFSTANYLPIFNTTYGAYDCSPNPVPGVIDARNNVFATVSKTPNLPATNVKFAYCGDTNLSFGKNWVSSGWITGTTTGTITGTANLIAGASSLLKFTNVATGDLHLSAGSAAIAAGAVLAPEVTANALGANLSPNGQYLPHRRVTARETVPSPDLGAYSYPAVLTVPPGPPTGLRIIRQ